MTTWSGNLTSHLTVAPWTSSHHSIYHLAEEANARFEKIQRQQSQSLLDVVADYKKRYGRSPPPGFDEWCQFAVDNDVQWIDEYDYLTRSLEPFWQMPSKILRNYVNQALADDEDLRFNTLEVKNHVATLRFEGFQHAQLIELIQPILHFLPDFKAVLNEADEPRVLIPYDMLHNVMKHSESISPQPQPIYFTTQDRQIVWSTITLPCSPDSMSRSAVADSTGADPRQSFISDLGKAQDICLLPASFSKKHGFLASPSTFHYTQSLVPVMSTAKFSTFQDVMIPSSYYFEDYISEYDESKDTPWEQKQDMVYWRGSGTGGHWTNGSWQMGHRQRFVNYTNFAAAEILLLQESTPGGWAAYESRMSQIKDKFDVQFSGFPQCDPQDCEDQESYFHKARKDRNNDANQYKILYNLDGNSFSGRYYRFLKSNSLVFMQAMFKEWHDDRLIPWVHFVPISLSMEELPETTRYVLDDPEGQVIAARIANASREWARRVLRPIDLTVAYYRVFLEYARLLDDNRGGMS